MSEFEDLLVEPEPTPEDGMPIGPKRRFRRLRRYGPWVIIGMSLLIASLPALLSTAWTRDLILSWLESNVDRPVRFADLDVSWTDGIQLTDLEIHDPDNPDRPLLVAPRVHVDAPLLPLLGRRLVVSRCLIESPEINIARTESGTSADGTLRRKRATRKPGKRGEDRPDEPEVALVLPEISVPIEVRDATLIFRGRSGREARQEGITLTGDFNTRDGPTTFELSVPGGGGAGLRVGGELQLFDEDGLLLSAEDRRIDVRLDITKFDAQRHDDLMALALGDLEVAGVIDAHIAATVRGRASTGSIDLRLLEVGVGDGVATPTRSGREDLTIEATWKTGPGRVRVDGLQVRAEGVAVDLDLDAGWDAVQGDGKLEIDLRRVGRHLASLGLDLPGDLTGVVHGTVAFPGGAAPGRADLRIAELGLDRKDADGGDVSVGEVRAAVRATAGPERFLIDALELSVPGLDVAADGVREADGKLLLTSKLSGRVEELLATLRSLRVAPERLALQGAIDGTIAAAYAPGDGLLLEVQRLAVADGDTGIRVRGRRDPNGELAFDAEGDGDLARLLGLAGDEGEEPAFAGTFSFVGNAVGTPGAVTVSVGKLVVDGDVDVNCVGKIAADGALVGTGSVGGALDDLAVVAQRLGALDRDLTIPGRIEASFEIAGTRERPVVPRLSVRMEDGPLTLVAEGSLGEDGAIDGGATLNASLQDVFHTLEANGFLTQRVDVAGTLSGHFRVAGTRDAVEIPEAVLTCTESPIDLSLRGTLDAERRIDGSARIGVPLAELVRIAHATGKLARDVELAGRLQFDGTVGGTLDEFSVPTAALRIDDGPVTGRVVGALDPSGVLNVQGKLEATLAELAELARAARDLDAPEPIDGTLTANFTANGPREAPYLRLPELTIRSAGAEVQLTGQRTTEGKLTAHGDARGAIADLLALARAFGVEKDWDADGKAIVGMDVEAQGDDLRASLLTRVSALRLRRPEIGGGPFREDELQLEVPTLVWDRAAGAPKTVQARVKATGLDLDVRLSRPSDAAPGGKDLVAKGVLNLGEEFARAHPKLVAEIELASAEIPFELRGDLAGGKETLGSWTGEILVKGRGARTEHFSIESVAITGKLGRGVLDLDPIDASVNTGRVSGRASIAVAGAERNHATVLEGTDLEIDHELAPLLARVLPVFAVGEYGKVGGKVGFDLDLAGSGAEKEEVKRTLAGKGEVRVRDAFVQSESWLEKVLSAVGKGKEIDLPEVVAPFRVKDGRVVTDGIPIASSAISMRLEGGVALDGELDYRVKVKPARENKSFDRYARFVDKDGWLPVRLGGEVSDPSVKLPSLKDILSGDGVKDALKDALDRYRKKKKDKEEEKKKKPPPRKKKRKKKNKKKKNDEG